MKGNALELESRVRPSRPFSDSGVDYAGPFMIRSSKGRGIKAYKGYIVVFICLGSRAVHLEVASNYSATGFLSAFGRFVSRRGLPRRMFSDQGTTFAGGDRKLKELFTASSLKQSSLKTLYFRPFSQPHPQAVKNPITTQQDHRIP